MISVYIDISNENFLVKNICNTNIWNRNYSVWNNYENQQPTGLIQHKDINKIEQFKNVCNQKSALFYAAVNCYANTWCTSLRRNSLLAEHFPHSVLKLLILNGVDEWSDDGIHTNHVHCKTVELTCKTTQLITKSTKGSFKLDNIKLE